MRLMAAGLTNVGMKRTHNEDNHVIVMEENLFVVADGMGGHASGEVASEIAVTSISEFFRTTSADEEQTWPYKEEMGLRYEENRLVAGIKLANRRIFETAQADVRKRGMGTTIVGALFTSSGAYVGHCGDSRAYRWRNEKLDQLTEDHSLLNEMQRNHKLTPEEIEHFPQKNVILRALGMKDTVQVDVSRMEPMTNDIYLLCSDGLSGMIKDEDICEIVTSCQRVDANDIDTLCRKLIDTANVNGGTDNVTCIVVKCVP
jgi:PPM family protein phosphatase